MGGGDVERVSHRARPRQARDRGGVLFVGESRPASGRHFEAGDSALFRAVRRAFHTALPRLESAPDFIAAFRKLGCAMVDLCPRPVNRLSPAARRRARRRGVARLAGTIAFRRPRVVVVVVRAIDDEVDRALERAGWRGERISLPYPGRWIASRRRFVAQLAAALRRWRRRGILRAAARSASVSGRIAREGKAPRRRTTRAA